MPASSPSRLAYIDWMRGLACVLMFQTHCYDAWLNPESRKTTFFMWSQLGGTLPAPLFLFLAGISFALVTDKLRQKGLPRERHRAHNDTARRGNSRTRSSVPFAGICHRLGMGSLERSFPSGYPEYDRPFHHADGPGVLDRSQVEPGIACSPGAGWGCRRRRSSDFAADPAYLDYLAPTLVALADRIVRRRRPQSGAAASVALPDLPLDRVRIRWSGSWILSIERLGA